MGPEEAIIGALIEGARFRPKKKKVIFIVIPRIDKRKSFSQSIFFTSRFFAAKGKTRSMAKKNLKKAKVNGGRF